MVVSDSAAPDTLAERGRHRRTIAGKSLLNLTNLLLRQTDHRVVTLQRDTEPDPEIYVVTRVEWRDPSVHRPVLPQLPRLLSVLEALRGTQGVPTEIYLDSTEGLTVYLRTGVRLSELPASSRDAVALLTGVVHRTVSHLYSTVRDVEEYFWMAARRHGFSPEIVEKMALGVRHFDSPALRLRFSELMHSYFSIRFRIHRAEGCLRVEGG